jgi:hypothetical protein
MTWRFQGALVDGLGETPRKESRSTTILMGPVRLVESGPSLAVVALCNMAIRMGVWVYMRGKDGANRGLQQSIWISSIDKS